MAMHNSARTVPAPKPALSDPDRYLDKALVEQQEKLFNAEAIIATTMGALEHHIGEMIDAADLKTPNFPRALEEAVRLIRSAYGGMEMVTLRARTVTLKATDKDD